MGGPRVSAAVLDIPDDLRAFLLARRSLKYPKASCEAGKVTLRKLQDLRVGSFPAQTYGTPHADADPHRGESGTYSVQGVDLVESCTGDYDPDGLLVWFPAEASYGVCDTEHDYILLFGSHVRWPDIAGSPARFINAQWAFEGIDRAAATFLAPWHHHPWRG
jgi:hypothetical protein